MAAFKKSFLVLAVAILALAGAGGTAYGQHPSSVITCVATAVPAQSRAEGIAELQGDLVAQCTIPAGEGFSGGTPSILANISVTLNVNVTNNRGSGSSPIASGGDANTTDAVLIVNETYPTAPTVLSTASGVSGAAANIPVPQYGSLVAPNTLQWTGVLLPVPAVAPNAPTTTIRITNMRGNVSQLGIPDGSGIFPSAQVTAFLSISSQTAIPVTNNVLNVGVPLRGLIATLTGPKDASQTFPVVALQCVDHNVNGSGDPNNVGSAIHINDSADTAQRFGDFAIKLQEGYASAFKTLGTPTVSPASATWERGYPTPVSNCVTGVAPGPPGLSTDCGGATQGTRFIIRFYNVPNGVRISTPNRIQNFGTPVSGHRLDLIKVVGTDGNGAGPLNASLSPSTEISITGGFGFVIYEVIDDNPFAVETILVPVTVSHQAKTASDLPATGTFQVSAAFAPLSTVTTSNAAAPEPRFVDTGVNRNAYSIAKCITNLLFPFVTNQAGFDTGFAISNTSVDDKGTSAQAGKCTLYYFGGTTGGGAAPPNNDTNVVAGGKQIVWTLSGGNPAAGINGAPGFQGYLMAQCQFQFAHGFAFITDGYGGVPTIAEGYLALVVPWNGVAGGRAAGIGESLAH